ncbi:glyoxalase [Aureibacillus halotolerans]|uniref:VOC domain-containing protein n=1 Tax=Aureibacillus halotolerans TaxID=1508390 RepID=A0A4R6TXS1_9BACI|nr:glyoxalase [Aureibacillus halotolerans]TDQ38690.1 hypothetical protein EV213_10959 [Aureibacillus halotolerans]
MYLGIDHVQIAIPSGQEESARHFYKVILGFNEIPKPLSLQGRGGFWLQVGHQELHVGAQSDFLPAKKAHPAFLVSSIAKIISILEANGIAPLHDAPIPGKNRVSAIDPFGNKLEWIEHLTEE